MALFAIGDPHLSLGSAKPMDIFRGWENYTERLRQNWNEQVTSDDLVVIVGDISWAMELPDALEDFRFIESLNGRKAILKGNHDYWWSSRSKIENFFDVNGLKTIEIVYNSYVVYENVGICGTRGWTFERSDPQNTKILAREAGRLELSLSPCVKAGLEPIVFLHYPPVYGTELSQPILDVLDKYSVKRCYYGHLHAQAVSHAFEGMYNGVDYRLVSADYLRFSPLRIM